MTTKIVSPIHAHVVGQKEPVEFRGLDAAARPAADGGGRKDDKGKRPWHLLPFDALNGIIDILAFGRDRYGARNWERGMDWSRPFDACMRHLTAWYMGERADPDTGKSHLLHAGCCILFLITYEMRGIGNDDRPIKPATQKDAA